MMAALFTVLALVAALVFVLTKPNNNSNQSSMTDSDKHSTANDQPAQKNQEQTPTAPQATGTVITTGDVNGSLLGTTKRTDGTTQVTYNGHPLYYYAHEAPGEVKCHNISTHGGLWWVIQPNGNRAN